MEVSSEAGTEGITGWGKGNERKKGISSWFGSILCPWRNGVCNKKPSGIQGLGRVSSGTSDYPHRGKQKKEDLYIYFYPAGLICFIFMCLKEGVFTVRLPLQGWPDFLKDL